MITLELHNVTIGSQIKGLSLTVEGGQMACIAGNHGVGKTTLVRAVMGFIPVDSGHICVDGELLTPQSAPYFRRHMAYVPQQLSVPEGYHEIQTDYLWLLRRAVENDKPLLIADEPARIPDFDTAREIDQLLRQAVEQGKTVLAVNSRITENQIRL